jgi:2-haloacid dehalogenase
MPAAEPDPPARDAATPTAVVFDLGGVLIDWNPRYLYRKLFDDEAAMESFLADVVSPEWNGQQDSGRTWAEAVDVLTREHPEQRDLIAAYWHRWQETLGDAIAPTVDVLEELRRTGVRLFALSNWSAETFPVARPRYPFLETFDGIVISGEEKLAKPDPRIFRHLLDRYDLDPAATVFIDDSEANVRAAAAQGMIALRFEDAATLRRDLVGLGLLD